MRKIVIALALIALVEVIGVAAFESGILKLDAGATPVMAQTTSVFSATEAGLPH